MSTEPAHERVRRYLDRTAERFARGTDEYYARLALEQALVAFSDGDYGIGAVAVECRDGLVREWRERNAMMTGLGVIDHAETRGLMRLVGDAPADDVYKVDSDAFLPGGISVYSTFEPCPMCTCTLTNAGAVRSVSTVIDGDLIEEDGLQTTDGSAVAIGRKSLLQPRVWRLIQEKQRLRFDRLATEDEELLCLSSEIFTASGKTIDRMIAERKGGGRRRRPQGDGTSSAHRRRL